MCTFQRSIWCFKNSDNTTKASRPYLLPAVLIYYQKSRCFWSFRKYKLIKINLVKAVGPGDNIQGKYITITGVNLPVIVPYQSMVYLLVSPHKKIIDATFHLHDRTCRKSIRLPMGSRTRFFIRTFHQAINGPRFFIKPILVIYYSILLLNGQIL